MILFQNYLFVGLYVGYSLEVLPLLSPQIIIITLPTRNNTKNVAASIKASSYIMAVIFGLVL